MDDIPMALRFSIIHRFLRYRMDERLREKELTGVQLGVLSELERLERSGCGEINQRELEKASRVTHPTMAEIVKRLDRKGFIHCSVSGTDRRAKCITSTEKARCLHKEMCSGDEELFDELCAGLSEQQIASLREITAIMLKNICERGCGKREQ